MCSRTRAAASGCRGGRVGASRAARSARRLRHAAPSVRHGRAADEGGRARRCPHTGPALERVRPPRPPRSPRPADARSPRGFPSYAASAGPGAEAWMNAPDDDGWAAFSEGAFAALGELVASLGPGRDAVVVTSGGVVAALCGRLLGESADLQRSRPLRRGAPGPAHLPLTREGPLMACGARHYPGHTYRSVPSLWSRERQETRCLRPTARSVWQPAPSAK